ncbi:hypothetical protein VNO78_32042 [Psophocarpus tetragonolobus]|uniref:Uncharacterized protein n=1 Tax=Psophocarpus tetragonolobus TaxID=3891 RepID=A0AAN9RZS6_PSOTE
MLTQLFVSVFIFSPSSCLLFLHYFKFYFSTFPFQLYTHNIDKNCIFLLCNGLLVFVGITKSLSASGADDNNSCSCAYLKDDSQSTHPHQHNTALIEIENFAQEKGISSLVFKEHQDTQLLDVGDEHEHHASELDCVLIQEDEQNVQEDTSMLSTEELNKKIEDFIRKMKEDLRIQAQRQLVML